MEMAIGAALIIVITTALLGADLAARYSMRIARQNLEATTVLATFVEQEKAQAYVNIDDSVTPDVLLSDAGTADAADDVTGTITIDVTDNGDDTKTIVGTATWNFRFLNQTMARTIELQTLVAEP
jgi:hypothetical protein